MFKKASTGNKENIHSADMLFTGVPKFTFAQLHLKTISTGNVVKFMYIVCTTINFDIQVLFFHPLANINKSVLNDSLDSQ